MLISKRLGWQKNSNDFIWQSFNPKILIEYTMKFKWDLSSTLSPYIIISVNVLFMTNLAKQKHNFHFVFFLNCDWCDENISNFFSLFIWRKQNGRLAWEFNEWLWMIMFTLLPLNFFSIQCQYYLKKNTSVTIAHFNEKL